MPSKKGNAAATGMLRFDWSEADNELARPVNVFAMQRFRMNTVLTFGLAFPPSESYDIDDDKMQEYFESNPLKVQGVVRMVMAPDTIATLAKNLHEWVKPDAPDAEERSDDE